MCIVDYHREPLNSPHCVSDGSGEEAALMEKLCRGRACGATSFIYLKLTHQKLPFWKVTKERRTRGFFFLIIIAAWTSANAACSIITNHISKLIFSSVSLLLLFAVFLFVFLHTTRGF
jgi:hypothetical protein